MIRRYLDSDILYRRLSFSVDGPFSGDPRIV